MAASPDIVFLHPSLSDLPDALKETIFNPDKLRRAGLITRELPGRGITYFFRLRDRSCVLRHYWRGGFMRRLSKDAYLWLGLKRSRAYREWKMLETLENFDLPAPRRVALRIRRDGFCCRSDIVTGEIEHITPLASYLSRQALSETGWQRIGKTILQFHQHGVFHQDLNASNILLGDESCHLIDFDRGRLMRGEWWKIRMLNRLKHSLEKLSGKQAPFHFNAMDWSYLMDGYDSA